MKTGMRAVVVGGGMITADLILPSLYHLQRRGILGEIEICALGPVPLRALAASTDLHDAFPGQGFTPHPGFDTLDSETDPELFARVIAALPPRQLVVVAVPDQAHYPVIMKALEHDQHVLCVKPLVLRHTQAVEIARAARERGLFVGVEYHKRFDRRSLLARREYGMGRFGEFVMGEARLIEPYYYRHSNFQNWFTVEATDPFTYIGCHYVDLVFFITGLRPVEVSVAGVRRRFPNGNEGFLWSSARVRWENGALLSVTNGLGYPDQAAGSNDQGLLLYCEGNGRNGMIRHDDHDRGVSYAYLDGIGPGGSAFNYVSPDFFRLVPWEGEAAGAGVTAAAAAPGRQAGLRPVGYGYDSIEALVEAAQRVERAGEGLSAARALAARQGACALIDVQGLLATPANSAINEQVIEAARKSILANGTTIQINADR